MPQIHLLLVDDDSAFVSVLSRRLHLRGFEVATAGDGEEALVVLNHQPAIEVVVLDLKMPGPNGLETLVNIKKSHPLVEVLLLTGQGDVVSGVCSIKEGAFDFLQKPFDTDDLAGIIEKAAARKREHEKQVLMIRSAPPLMRASLMEKAPEPVKKIFSDHTAD